MKETLTSEKRTGPRPTLSGQYVQHPERIKGAAIQLGGLTFWLPPPYRHHHIIERLSDLGLPWPIKGEQGFVIPHAAGGMAFLTRRDAAMVCEVAGELYSEDLW